MIPAPSPQPPRFQLAAWADEWHIKDCDTKLYTTSFSAHHVAKTNLMELNAGRFKPAAYLWSPHPLPGGHDKRRKIK